MAELITVAELKDFLAIPSGTTTWDTLLGDLRDQVKELLERACGRDQRPFQDAQAGRIERQDGTGSSELFLDYPIAALSQSILVGGDPAAPDETLSPTDKTKVRWIVGHRRISRVDDGQWKELDAPLVVQVTYNAAADLPKAAKMAVTQVVAAVYRQRGSEDVNAERTGGYSADLKKVIEEQPAWAAAVAVLSEITV